MYRPIHTNVNFYEMNILLEASASQWSGLLDPESIPQEEKPELYKKIDLVGRANYKYPDGSMCSGHKFKGSKAAANQISKLLKFGFFALMWSGKEVQVIFKNRIFTIENTNPFCQKTLEGIVEYGKKIGVKRMYFDHLRQIMQEPKKSSLAVQAPFRSDKKERQEVAKNAKATAYEPPEVMGWKPGRA
jgi:hypothetical protein